MTASIQFLRAKNGKGYLYNNSEEIDSVIDKFSNLHGNSSVFNSFVFGSTIKNSTITRSVLTNCYVANSNIFGSECTDSIFGCELISTKGNINNSHVLNRSRVLGKASLDNVRFKRLTVFGEAKLISWGDKVFDGKNGYIGYGTWFRPPKVLRISNITITESIPGYAFVGCRHQTIEYWLKFGERIGVKFNVSKSEVEKIRLFLQSLS